MSRVKRRGGLAPHKYLSERQESQLRVYVRREADRARRRGSKRAIVNEFIIKFLLDTGLRVEEAVGVKLEDTPRVHGKNKLEVIGKGNVGRTVDISEATALMIERFVAECRKGAKPGSVLIPSERGHRRIRTIRRVWNPEYQRLETVRRTEYTSGATTDSIRSRLGIIGKKAGLIITKNKKVKPLSPHMLRHTFAVKLYAVGRDIVNVADQLGHADTRTTEIYAKTRSSARIKQIERLNDGLRLS